MGKIPTFIFIPNLNKIVKTKKIKLHLFRSLLLFCATLSMFSGFKYLTLVSTITIFQIGPLVVVVFSVIFLKEKVGYRRWLSVFVGFSGTLFILKPGTEMFSFLVYFQFLQLFFMLDMQFLLEDWELKKIQKQIFSTHHLLAQ